MHQVLLRTEVQWVSRRSTYVAELHATLAAFFMENTIFTWERGWQTWVFGGLTDLGIWQNVSQQSEPVTSRKTTDLFVADDNIWAFKQKLECLENLYLSLWAWQLPNKCLKTSDEISGFNEYKFLKYVHF